MKRLALVLGVLVCFLLSTAFGQGNLLRMQIPFDFVAGGKTLPAGHYDVSVSKGFVELKNHDTGNTVTVVVQTRIAADNTAAGRARISFDVQEGKHFIEAVWPDKGDGYLLHTVKGEHTHDIVRSQ